MHTISCTCFNFQFLGSTIPIAPGYFTLNMLLQFHQINYYKAQLSYMSKCFMLTVRRLNATPAIINTDTIYTLNLNQVGRTTFDITVGNNKLYIQQFSNRCSCRSTSSACTNAHVALQIWHTLRLRVSNCERNTHSRHF